MSLLGKKIKLAGKSQKGRNRIRDNGNEWQVLAETNHVLFSQNSGGPWLFITPMGQDQYHKSCRWVRVTGDQDFVVVVMDD